MTFANDCANCCFFRTKLMRKERKILHFVPQKLRKSFANGNPNKNIDLCSFLTVDKNIDLCSFLTGDKNIDLISFLTADKNIDLISFPTVDKNIDLCSFLTAENQK